MTRTPARLAAWAVAILLLATPLARAQETVLHYDSYVNGQVANFPNWLVTGEGAAVTLTPPGPLPMQITRVQFLFGGAAGTRTVTLRIWDDPGGGGDYTPGTQLYSADYSLTANDTTLQEIDLTSAAISVSGPFRVGIEYQHDGLPTIAEDQDGNIYGGVNFQRYKTGPGTFTWYDWSTIGGEGDWVLRAGVIPDPNMIFSDGFESQGLGAWSAAQTGGGDLTVSDEAKMAGTGYGLKAVVNDTAPLYVEDDGPSAEARYRARFYFDPNGFDPGIAQNHLRTRIFIAFSANPTRRVAAIVLRRQGSTFSVMGRARLDDNTQADTGFVTISDAPHYIELDLKRSTGPTADDGYLQIWVDNAPSGSRAGLDNSATLVDFVRMGGLSVKTGAAGTLYWDEFKSKRGGGLIGP
jgi:hypothetical protein